MAHDVFISYSSKDKPTADATCATLEQQGHPLLDRAARHPARRRLGRGDHRCDPWLARLCAGLFQQRQCLAPDQARGRARHQQGIPVIPLRIENVMPDKVAGIFPLHAALAGRVQPAAGTASELSGRGGAQRIGRQAGARAAAAAGAQRPALDRRLVIGGGVGVVALAGAGYFLFGRKPSFVGNWTAESIDIRCRYAQPLRAFLDQHLLPGGGGGRKTQRQFHRGRGRLVQIQLGRRRYRHGRPQGGNAHPLRLRRVASHHAFHYHVDAEPAAATDFDAGRQPGRRDCC